MKLRAPVVSALSAITLGACTDAPTATAPVAQRPDLSVVAAEVADRYVVRLNKKSAGLQARVEALGGRVEFLHEGVGMALVSGIGADAANALAGVSGVAEVLADPVIALDRTEVAPVASDVLGTPGIASQANPATAIRYSWQWNMRAIDADDAWAAGKLGSPGITIAILDTGIDYTGLDMAGMVDLSRSRSFVPSDDAIIAANFPGRHPIDDLNGHGTNVATQAASNGTVHAGVSSRSTLIGVKVLGATGSGSLGGILAGVLHSADVGADVINMSIQGAFQRRQNGGLVSLLNQVFHYASKAGAVVVVAAGNNQIDLDRNIIPTPEGPVHVPGLYETYCDVPSAVCVSATGPLTWGGDPDVSSYYTNYGRSAISVAAPGGNASATVSTWPWGPGNVSWVWSMCPINLLPNPATPAVRPCASGLQVNAYIGTSQASPHVAGLAALLMAEKGPGKPSQIKSAILKGAEDRGQPGTDPYYGKGRINVARSLGL